MECLTRPLHAARLAELGSPNSARWTRLPKKARRPKRLALITYSRSCGAVTSMISEMVGQTVIVDMRSPYVCLGVLSRIDERMIELRDADVHDMRDTITTRENYIAASAATGIKRNRTRVLIMRDDIVAVSLLEDFVDE